MPSRARARERCRRLSTFPAPPSWEICLHLTLPILPQAEDRRREKDQAGEQIRCQLLQVAIQKAEEPGRSGSKRKQRDEGHLVLGKKIAQLKDPARSDEVQKQHSGNQLN